MVPVALWKYSIAMIKRAVVNLLQYVPKPLVWRVSKRYIAGESIEDALDLVTRLNRDGMCATLDVLGEDSTNLQQAHASRDIYLEALKQIHQRQLDCNISVKLSQMALRLDEGECREIARALAQSAREHDNFLRIDMEDTSVTSATLDVYRKLRTEFDNVGTVVQAYLRRTEADVATLLDEGVTNLRLCKGIYREPEELAFQDREEVRDSFKRLLGQLFEGGAQRVGIATHDEPLVTDALEQIKKHNVDPDRYEFQMLLGVTERMRNRLVADGHPLRVYVPFGADWFPYSIRRLRENPQIASHVIRGMFSWK